MKSNVSMAALRFIVSAICAVLLCAALAVFATAAHKSARAEEPVAENVSSLYTYTDNMTDKTKIGDYATVDEAFDKMDEDKTQKYVIELHSDYEIEITNEKPKIALSIKGLNLTLNGNGHILTVQQKCSVMIQGDAHVVINDLVISCVNADSYSRCIQIYDGRVYLEMNRSVLHTKGGYGQHITAYGGSITGVCDAQVGDEVIKTTVVLNDCSIGKPIDGRTVGGKPIPDLSAKSQNDYCIMCFTGTELTLNNTGVSGWSAVYLKHPENTTGARGSVVNITNGSYLRGMNSQVSGSNTFGTIVVEDTYYAQNNTVIFDADDDGIIDYVGKVNGEYNGKNVGDLYDLDANVEINIENSTIESTSINAVLTDEAHQYALSVRPGGNKIEVSGDSAIITSDPDGVRPTKAVKESRYGTNEISITGGMLFKWDQLPAHYIKSDVAVGDMLYATFAEAMSDAKDGDTVKLIRNTMVGGNDTDARAAYTAVASVAENVNITLDLNGKTMFMDTQTDDLALLENAGGLTVKNGVIERSSDSAAYSVFINNGSLTLTDLYVTDRTAASDHALIVNNGELEVKYGSFVSTGNSVVLNAAGGSALIEGGSLESKASGGAAIVNSGEVGISGGTLKGETAILSNSSAKTEITGGRFRGAFAVENNAAVTVKGGTFDASVRDVVARYVPAGYQISEDGPTVSVVQFVAKSGLVYDGKTYALGTALNALLNENYLLIDNDMTVAISAYKSPDGEQAEIPAAVCNAGVYTIEVTLADGSNVDFELNIARQKISLANMDWQVKDGGLLESTTVYVYASNSDPTSIVYSLSSTAPNDHSLKDTLTVERGVAKISDGNAEITFVSGLPADVCAVEVSGVNSAAIDGVYTASVKLSLDENYEIVTNTVASEFGMSVVDNRDGSYTLSKIWYAFAMQNWLIDKQGHDYAPPSGHVFGTAPVIAVPWLFYGDDYAAEVSPILNDHVYLTLYRNGVVIGENFRRYQFANYFNTSMPVGDYVLVVNVDAVGGRPDFSRSYRYSVTPAPAPSALAALMQELNASGGYVFEWDGYMHLYNEQTAAKLETLKTAIALATPERSGVWLDNDHDGLYGGLEFVFNLDRIHNNHYYEENVLIGLSARPAEPGVYTVYYKLSALNFEPFIALDETADNYDVVRRNYAFSVKIIREVALPSAVSVVYNGTAQKADILPSDFYTVTAYDGFVDVGKYEVSVSLVDPECYYWTGKTVGEENKTIAVGFEITKAPNKWLETPDIVRWVEGKYNEEEHRFIGAALFGEITFIVTDIDGEKVYYDASKGINDLSKLKAGDYYIQASVAGTGNYDGLPMTGFIIKVLDKAGMPWWATLLIAVGSLLIVAIVILILWKKGVFRIVTDKILLNIKTKVAVESTIASVRAQKMREDAARTRAEAIKREQAEERKAMRAERAKARKAMPEEVKIQQAEERAKKAAERAEKARQRAVAMEARIRRMREKAGLIQPDEAQAEAAAAETTTDE